MSLPGPGVMVRALVTLMSLKVLASGAREPVPGRCQ